MELNEIVVDSNKLSKFVRENFKPLVITKLKKTELDHPLLMLNFNRALKNTDIRFTAFGLNVDDIYVYMSDKGGFCTFLLMEILPYEFDNIVEKLGFPENMPKEDYLNGDYDFLVWSRNGFDVYVNKNHAGKDKKNKYIVQLLNMQYEEIIDMTAIR
ncbi:MAG: hypothetical protein ACQUHE_01545 [Bacteroidia bacterium]